jgi:two-component system chemotaxis response regulator CheB
VRLAVVHGSPGVARALQRVLQEGGEHEVLWTAQRAAAALDQLAERAPELLLLDAAISDPSCVEVTRQVVGRKTCGVLLLADRPQAHMTRIYEAMGHGALDVVACPLSPEGKLLSCTLVRAKLRSVARVIALSMPPPRKARGHHSALVAIGASTGGPQALYRILSELPGELSPAIVVVQHVDSEFSVGLSQWLQEATGLKVSLATTGQAPRAGEVLLATSEEHLVMTAAGTLAYTEEPKHSPYRPSIDVLFQSLAEHHAGPATAVLLTGMGRDGAAGLKSLREAGWHTIAQDEASSVVFGMPKAAIELGAAERVVSLDGMAAAIAGACE